MDPLVAKMCGRYCQNSFVITRNEESRTVLRELDVPTELGTDTAWTFEPHPAEYGQKGIARCWLGWQYAGAGGVSDQSFRMAGEGFDREVCGARL